MKKAKLATDILQDALIVLQSNYPVTFSVDTVSTGDWGAVETAIGRELDVTDYAKTIATGERKFLSTYDGYTSITQTTYTPYVEEYTKARMATDVLQDAMLNIVEGESLTFYEETAGELSWNALMTALERDFDTTVMAKVIVDGSFTYKSSIIPEEYKTILNQAPVIPVTGVTYTNTEGVTTIPASSTFQLEWDVLPVDASDVTVTFDSDNLTSATVGANGLIITTATLGAGITVTITTNDGGFTDTFTFDVV